MSILPQTSVFENLWRFQVELGGGVFLGVLPGKSSLGTEPLILFDDDSAPKERRVAFAIKAIELTADKVRTEIRKRREENSRFEAFAEKAAKQIFSQFAKSEAA